MNNNVSRRSFLFFSRLSRFIFCLSLIPALTNFEVKIIFAKAKSNFASSILRQVDKLKFTPLRYKTQDFPKEG